MVPFVHPIKVLQVVHSLPDQGGIETWLSKLTDLRDPRFQFDFFVYLPGGKYEKNVIKNGSNVFHAGCVPKWKLLFFALAGRLTNCWIPLNSFLKNHKYDVVHVNGVSIIHIESLRCLYTNNVPVRVEHFHSNYLLKNFLSPKEVFFKLHKIFSRGKILKYTTDVIACSPESGESGIGKRWNKEKKCKTLFCGIDIYPFEKALKSVNQTGLALREKYGIPVDAVVVGHIGSISLGKRVPKNHPFIFKVFAELCKRHKNYYLFLAGNGNGYVFFKKMAEKMGVSDRVIMPGVCSIPELVTSLFDVFLFPSLYEGLPLSVLEAIAGGVYVVGSQALSIVLKESCLGSRMETISLGQDVSYWANRIERGVSLRQDPDLALENFKKSPFTMQACLDNLYELYSKRLAAKESIRRFDE